MIDSFTATSIQNNAGLPAWNALLDPAGFLKLILPYFFGVAGIVLVFMIISSGYKLMTSAGDPKATSAAQAKITNAVLGIFIMFVSFWVVKLILQFFGIDLDLF